MHIENIYNFDQVLANNIFKPNKMRFRSSVERLFLWLGFRFLSRNLSGVVNANHQFNKIPILTLPFNLAIIFGYSSLSLSLILHMLSMELTRPKLSKKHHLICSPSEQMCEMHEIGFFSKQHFQ